jgi:hypothetical protein
MPYNEIKVITLIRRCGHGVVTVQSSEDDTFDIIVYLQDPEAFVTLVNAMMRTEYDVGAL